MRRAVLSFVVLALLGVPGLAAQEAQEAQEPTHVYEAYYAISFGDLDEWNRRYFEYTVPVMQSLVDEGVIEGWDQYQHQTGGGEYNIRFAVRAFDWDAYDEFWSEFFSRLQAAMPEGELGEGGRMITKHTDAIWNIQFVAVPENMEYTHLYASTFQLAFTDMGEWNDAWEEVVAPILEQAMSEGTLAGWVKLGHNTGGSHNSKVLYFFNGWDNIDDLFGMLLGTIQTEHPDTWTRINELFVAHDDAIWAPTTRDGM